MDFQQDTQNDIREVIFDIPSSDHLKQVHDELCTYLPAEGRDNGVLCITLTAGIDAVTPDVYQRKIESTLGGILDSGQRTVDDRVPVRVQSLKVTDFKLMGIPKIRTGLKEHMTLVMLHLTRVGHIDLAHLREALASIPTLRCVKLEKNDTVQTTDSITAFAQGLAASRLESLHLVHYKITKEQMRILVNTVLHHATLTVFDVEGNDLGSRCADIFVPLLLHSRTLCKLDLREIGMNRQDASHLLLLWGFARNRTLLELCLDTSLIWNQNDVDVGSIRMRNKRFSEHPTTHMRMVEVYSAELYGERLYLLLHKGNLPSGGGNAPSDGGSGGGNPPSGGAGALGCGGAAPGSNSTGDYPAPSGGASTPSSGASEGGSSAGESPSSAAQNLAQFQCENVENTVDQTDHGTSHKKNRTGPRTYDLDDNGMRIYPTE